MRKKVVITLIAAMTVTGMLAGCSQTEEPTENVSVETSEQTVHWDLRTDLIGDLVQSFDDPTIVECNTASSSIIWKASDCIKCGKCEKIYPQHLPIRSLLENVAAEFEK